MTRSQTTSQHRRLHRNDRFHLSAAEGWLELGNWFEANEALKRISPRIRVHPDVLHARYDVYGLAGDWAGAIEIARIICKLSPDCPFGFIKWARALHELERTKEARDVLHGVADKFDDDPEPDLPYELARYCCHLGEWAAAICWLKKAIHLDGGKEIKKRALDDPDLQKLRTQIREIRPGRPG